MQREQEPHVEEDSKLNQTLNKGIEQTDILLGEAEKYIKIRGSSAQNALLVQALELAIASIFTLLSTQIPPLVWILQLLPSWNFLNLLIYATILGLVQFGSGWFKKAPMNFLMFVLHGSAKIFFLTLYGTQYNQSRCDLFYFFLIFGIFYVLSLIKQKESDPKVDLSVRGNLFIVAFFNIGLGVYIVLLAHAGLANALWFPIGGTLYTYFILLVVERLVTLDYLKDGYNSLFLGAAQIDAELFWWCPLAIFHQQKGSFAQLPQTEQQEQVKTQDAQVAEQHKQDDKL
ncbi:hypothetical protein pb186bvf_010791 [Paramecium bursaria]